jgi:hypothetical protein
MESVLGIHLPAHVLKRLWKMVDEDGSGVLNHEEFIEFVFNGLADDDTEELEYDADDHPIDVHHHCDYHPETKETPVVSSVAQSAVITVDKPAEIADGAKLTAVLTSVELVLERLWAQVTEIQAEQVKASHQSDSLQEQMRVLTADQGPCSYEGIARLPVDILS